MSRDVSSNRGKSSNMVLKIGITYIIPIFLAICGLVLIFTAGWKEAFRKCFFYDNVKQVERKADQSNSLEVNGQRIFTPNSASCFAIIDIPSIGLNGDVYQGDYNDIMALGIGHNSFSGLPGFNRNCILRGLNTVDFANINQLKHGDKVTVSTDYGDYYYEVSDTKIYEKDDNSFMEYYGGVEKLTLYTDYPFDNISSTGQKYVVTCNFIKCEY